MTFVLYKKDMNENRYHYQAMINYPVNVEEILDFKKAMKRHPGRIMDLKNAVSKMNKINRRCFRNTMVTNIIFTYLLKNDPNFIDILNKYGIRSDILQPISKTEKQEVYYFYNEMSEQYPDAVPSVDIKSMILHPLKMKYQAQIKAKPTESEKQESFQKNSQKKQNTQVENQKNDSDIVFNCDVNQIYRLYNQDQDDYDLVEEYSDDMKNACF
ncbi:hypothetical protein TRFO_37137 [Tritrichomonas foetus]|uniref:Uncharacterized protein n=1 Tax=Tritrichomonas foetus TaxID=1144522 RepID=A0A1J4JDB1_9EUKA|nr:hypothetical protein TRFO_37137 [Tritrichomonas foetus]|eukprot:OHS96641.1 hypothetical protein TRFO_37137 [Tritrichomonas foetus]